MRLFRLLQLAALATAVGCNTLTGVDVLELTDDPTDAESGGADALDASADSSADSRVDSGADSSVLADVAEDGSKEDASPGEDAIADAPADTPTDAKKWCVINKECNDLNPCTADVCQVLSGVCTNTPIDADGDGESPSSAGACGLDCYDGNKDVYSKQTGWFTAAYATAAGTSSWDYDCNGAEEKQYTTLGACRKVTATTCTTGAAITGWNATAVPACGAKVYWLTGCTYNAFSGACIPVQAYRTQGCR